MKGFASAIVVLCTAINLGCTAPRTTAVITNDSEQTLIQRSLNDRSYALTIGPGKTKEIPWEQHRLCRVFDIDGERHYFGRAVSSAKDAVIPTISWGHIKLRVLYQDSKLYYDAKNKGLIPIREIDGADKNCRLMD